MIATKKTGLVVGAALAATCTMAFVMPAKAVLIAEYNFDSDTGSGYGTVVHDTSGYGTPANGALATEDPSGTGVPTFSSNAAVGTQSAAFAPGNSTAFIGLNAGETNYANGGTGSAGNGSGPATAGTPAAKFVALSTSAMTLSGWVNITTPASTSSTGGTYNSNAEEIISTSGSKGQINRGFSLDVDGSGHPRLQIATAYQSLDVTTATAVVPINSWHLVTGVFEPSSSPDGITPGLYVYLDGALANFTAASVANQYINIADSNNQYQASVNIGVSGSPPIYGATSWLTGNIDDVRVYNNGLTAAQVATLYTSSVPEPASLGLVALGATALIARRRRIA